MKRVLKGLAVLIFAVVPLLLLAGGAGLLWLSRSLPEPSGTVEIPGLLESVTIGRDGEGVPHVTASTREDVYAGLGFAHAQDRLWQMEVSRMAGQGRLSEIFGEATVDTDIWLRTVDMAGAAAASYKAFPDEAKRALEAYARGVNAWLEREPRLFAARLPPEFIALGHEPEPWQPQDAVTVVKMMSVGLASNVAEEVERLAFARAGMTVGEIEDLIPPHPGIDPPALPDLMALLEMKPADALEQARMERKGSLASVPDVGLTGRGASNNWVVAGNRTETGSPILANDPHLGLSAPSVWYLAHLRVEPEEGEPRNLVGATLAGAPLVLLGRNDDLAWGFTNTGADVQDLFIERLHPDDATRYETPEGWRPFDTRKETVIVKDGESITFKRRATRHGPVMPADYRGLGALLPENRVAALAWTALASDDTTMLAGLAVWDFRTVAEFQEGMADFVTPMQSIVLADTRGNIGLVAPARVPVRDPANAVMGRAPVPGWEATYDWKGTVDYADLPRITNPEKGAIGTANSRIVDDSYGQMLTLDWDETYRQRRVDQLVVDADKPHGMADSRAAQADVRSLAFATLVPQMLQLVEGREGIDRFVVSALGDWDYEMTREDPEPLIAMAWLRAATEAIFRDDLGAGFERWFQARGQVMENVLGGRTEREWCDRSQSEAVESCGDVLAMALATALNDLEERYGSDRNAWRWGKAHVAIGDHTPFGRVAVLRRLFNVEIESPGGPYTLNRGRTDFTDEVSPFANVHASSYRGIYDLADLDRSTYMISTGQSGNVFSRHYDDLAERWRDVEAIEIPADPDRWRSAAESVWQLVP